MCCLFVSRQGWEVQRATNDQVLVKLVFFTVPVGLENDRREKTFRREQQGNFYSGLLFTFIFTLQ